MVGNRAARVPAGARRRRAGGAYRTGLAGLVLALTLPAGGARAAETVEDAASELAGVRGRIERLTEGLGETRSARGAVEARLAATGLRLGEVVRDLRDIDRRLDAGVRELARLAAERVAERRALRAERESLARQLRAAHVLGRHDYLKLLLDQDDPGAVRRMMVYYRYFNRARTLHIAEIERRLARLDRLEADIGAETEALAALREDKVAARDTLDRTRAERNRLMARMQREIESAEERLERLQRDERRLAAVLEEVESAAVRAPEPVVAPDRPFAALRGALGWPAAGVIRHRYGTSRRSGDLTWSGVWLAAPEGTPVHAVSHGQVAYAGWLRGFGLLLIIDHGDGYMTLYGQSQALFKEVGEWVEAGEVVGMAGNGGARLAEGLYFEIRHRGAPQDPAAWCVPVAAGGRTALVTR